MKLVAVNAHDELHLRTLYDLLGERTAEQSISHKKMPTWEEHTDFVWRSGLRDTYRYESWCLVENDEGAYAGSIYLTERNEIGIHVFLKFRRRGYGEAACREIMASHGPRRYRWNTNPQNAASIALAEKLGFKLAQHTYSLEAE